MFVQSRELKRVKNDSMKIWRYLDFTKFVSLLDTEKLFLCRADQLDDPWEGSLSRANLDEREKQDRKYPHITNDEISDIHKYARYHVFISSWHMNEFESAAMWKLYLKSDEGIAIQSTLGDLKKSLDKTKIDVTIGKVEYIDYDKDVISEKSIVYPFVHKRKSFEHEKEICVLKWIMPPKVKGKPDLSTPNPNLGIEVEIDLQVLINNVYVSPTAPPWFFDLTKSVLKKYKVEKEVIKSNMTVDPVY